MNQPTKIQEKFVVRFWPDGDGQLDVKVLGVDQYAVQFDVTFNRRPNETPKQAFMRMCKEVTYDGT